MTIPLNVVIFNRGDNGVPSSLFFTDLRNRIDALTFTIFHQFGFESMTCPLKATVDEAIDWMNNGLLRPAIVYGPDAGICWEGFIVGIDAVFGQETRSVSLDGMANRLRVKYQTVLGTPGTTTAISDTASQLLYGIKDAVLSADQSDSTEAGYYAAVELVRRADPRMRPSTVVQTGELGDISLTLHFAGWYSVLDWLVTSNTSTTKTQTTTQIGTLLAAYNAVNNFLSAVTYNIVASGINVTEYIAAETTYREKIEALLRRGNGTQQYSWGIYEDRQFHALHWAGATPTTITYQRHLGDSNVYNSGGNIVEYWDVRPNAMYQANDLLDVGPVSSAQDAAGRFYVARTTCTVQGDQVGVSLEPEDPADLAAILVKKYQ